MRFMLALLGLALAAAPLAHAADDRYAAAVADSARPDADRAADAHRKPAEMLAFARVRPGDTVIELIPGRGYFTRLLSRAVGPNGVVYAVSPSMAGMDTAAKAIAADPRYPNVRPVVFDPAALAALPKADVIFTAQNYHDLHLTRVHQDVPAQDRLFFSLLKSGGRLIVIDHVALAGAPVTETADALHRIDPAFARHEIEGAGFVFDGESRALANPDDPHTANVFDPAIRGRTDQFAFRFVRP